MPRNESGLEPLGRAVLVRMIELEEYKASTIVIPDHVRRSSTLMDTRAEVLAIGAECWKDESQPRCTVGDKVIVTRMAGYVAQGPADGKLYRLVNDRDVFCKITKESKNG